MKNKEQWSKFFRYTCFDVAIGPLIAIVVGVPLLLLPMAIWLAWLAWRQIRKVRADRLAQQQSVLQETEPKTEQEPDLDTEKAQKEENEE